MALYNNGFPVTYPQYYMPVQQQNATQNTQGGRIWVQGESGAKSYLVAPNSTVDLWDSESPVIYIKSADASGMPGLKILDYTVRESNKTTPNGSSALTNDNQVAYATKDEIDSINGEIKALKTKLEKMIKRMKEDEDDE